MAGEESKPAAFKTEGGGTRGLRAEMMADRCVTPEGGSGGTEDECGERSERVPARLGDRAASVRVGCRWLFRLDCF